MDAGLHSTKKWLPCQLSISEDPWLCSQLRRLPIAPAADEAVTTGLAAVLCVHRWSTWRCDGGPLGQSSLLNLLLQKPSPCLCCRQSVKLDSEMLEGAYGYGPQWFCLIYILTLTSLPAAVGSVKQPDDGERVRPMLLAVPVQYLNLCLKLIFGTTCCCRRRCGQAGDEDWSAPTAGAYSQMYWWVDNNVKFSFHILFWHRRRSPAGRQDDGGRVRPRHLGDRGAAGLAAAAAAVQGPVLGAAGKCPAGGSPSAAWLLESAHDIIGGVTTVNRLSYFECRN